MIPHVGRPSDSVDSTLWLGQRSQDQDGATGGLVVQKLYLSSPSSCFPSACSVHLKRQNMQRSSDKDTLFWKPPAPPARARWPPSNQTSTTTVSLAVAVHSMKSSGWVLSFHVALHFHSVTGSHWAGHCTSTWQNSYFHISEGADVFSTSDTRDKWEKVLPQYIGCDLCIY